MADPEHDPESVERAFAELVAGYHLTADRPALEQAAPSVPESPPSETASAGPVERGWVEERPISSWRSSAPPDEPTPARYVPEPLPPLRRPSLPTLLGWVGVGFTAIVVLGAGFGLELPPWAGWLAVGTFVIGFALLLSQLPRHRPPDAGDGAVL